MTKLLLTVALFSSLSAFAQQISIGKVENRLSDGKTVTESTERLNLFYVGKDLQGADVEYPLTQLSYGGRLVGRKLQLHEHMREDVYSVYLNCFKNNPKGNEIRMMTSRDTFEYALTRRKGYEVYLVKRYQIPYEFSAHCNK